MTTTPSPDRPHTCWYRHDSCAILTGGPCSIFPVDRWAPQPRPAWLTADATWAVLELITDGPACFLDFARKLDMSRYGARLKELKDAGVLWDKRPCLRHPHRNPAPEYVLLAPA